MKIKRSKLRIVIALILILTVISLPFDALAWGSADNIATPDEAQLSATGAPLFSGDGSTIPIYMENGVLMLGDSVWTTTYEDGFTRYILPSGSYRLDSDISTDYRIRVNEGQTAVLDLGDHNIERLRSDGDAIEVAGELTVNGDNGKIINNNYGSAVLIVPSGSFTLNGGTITNNGGYDTSRREGVNVGGVFVMNGGALADNTKAVRLDDAAGIFILKGGSVTGNTYGIVLENQNATFSIDGNPVITGNTTDVYLGTGKKINIAGELKNTTPIIVTMQTPGIFTDGWNDTMGDADPSKYFTSVNETYDVFLNDNGEAEIGEYVPLNGMGTEEYPILIKSVKDWDALSESINSGSAEYIGKYFKMTADISVSTVLGNRPNSSTDSNDNYFSGTFDGDGHTLNVDINESGFGAAPFAIAHNATIKNLHVTGTVTSGANHATGLVTASKGRSIYDESYLTIQNVTVSTDISCPSHVAGIVGHAHSANITMENVVFDGSMSASSVQGGMIGWGGLGNGARYSASFKDCLFAGTYNTNAAFYPIAYANGQGTTTLVNDFYTTSFGSGGSPIAPTGDGQLKLLAAQVEKDGSVQYFDNINTAADSSNWVAGSTLRLMADVTTSSTITVPTGEHTLDLNGNGIKMTGSGSVINVGNGATLNVEDGSPDVEHKFTVADAASNGAGLATVDDTLTSDYQTFNGGYITGGNANRGGGVYVKGGTFTLTGGTIIGNQAQREGGGVFYESNSFSMNSGTIIYNKSQTHWGGGINVAGTFNMSGGVVSHNYAGDGAGGVHCHYLVMTGGSITDNHAVSSYAGGVNANNDATLSGNVTITGNTNNAGKSNLICKSVIIADALSDTSSIGIMTQSGTGVFTSGWKDKMGEADPSKYFTSDNDTYDVFCNNDGEAEIGTTPHEHNDISFKKWSSPNSLPGTADNYYLACDVTISSRWDVPAGTTNLCLNGHSITRTNASSNTGMVINVGSGAVLNLYDCDDETTHYYTVDDPSPNGAGLGRVVDESAYQAASETARGTFKGGYITGGSITGENTGTSHLVGGGVNVDSGSFTMNGGTIIGNSVTWNGGGVKVRGKNGSFTMNGGAILANWNRYYGGGISVGDNNAGNVCKLKINGGTIRHNWSGRNGGAIHLDGKAHTVLINGGNIIDNYTDGNLESTGRSGGGILTDVTSVQLSGTPVIKGNAIKSGVSNDVSVRANGSDRLDLSGHLEQGADVGIYVPGWTSANADYMVATGAEQSDIRYVHYDAPSEGLLVYCDGSKDWIYTDGELVEVSGGRHTHQAGTVWVSGLPVATVTAGETPTLYGSLDAAVSAWTAGSMLKLLTDVITGSTVTVPASEHTLDLNGYNLEAGSTGYSVVTVGSGAELTIDDTSENVGKITGGSVGQNYGGGVTVDGGTLTLKGGDISGNANTYGGIGNCGGGVHVRNGGKFYMEGGEISGNTSYVGGGVCTDTSATTVSITGGVIKNNKTERFGSAVWAGRSSSSIFRIGGDVQIIDNISTWSADKDGEASLNFVGALLLSGDPTVHGDWKTSGTSSPNTHINLDNDGSGVQRLTLEGALTNDTGSPNITMSPIYRWNDLRNGQTFVFTKNWNQYMGTAHPADYFKVDSGVSGVTVIRKDGEAAFTGSGDLGDLYITFDANGGESEMDAQLAKTSSVQLNKNTFTHKDLGFDGWNTKKDGSGTAYADGANITLSGDLTLYAQWKESVASIISGGTTTSYGSFSDAVNAWSAGSTLKLLSDVTTGSTITVPTGEHTLDLNGCGILMTGNDRVITINQGASLELNDSDPDRIHYITLTNYRGTAVSDSGEESVSNGNGVIKVTGGYLTGGYRNNSGSHDRCGAGVYNWGTFVMNGGSIVGNTLFNNSGGGIRNSGYFTMNGGTIAFNYASGNGGGVTTYVPGGSQGKMTMNGGEISDNYCGSYGGGIQIAGPIEMTGGSVVRNTAGSGGSGVFYDGKNDRFKLSGNPVIKDNSNKDDLYLGANATFMINGLLTEETDIHVLMNTPAEFTVGWKNIMGNADPSKYFTSNNSGYAVILNNNGEAEIGIPPVACIISGGTTTNYGSLSDAVNAWTAGSTLKLLSDVTTSSTISVPEGEHTLDLNGHGIKMTGSGSVISVGSGATLNVEDGSPDVEHKFTVADAASNGAGLATVDDTLTSDYQTFKGGYVTGGNSNQGGGVYVKGGTFTLTGGTIIGNQAQREGGGVFYESNSFSMNGGAIIYNKSQTHWGGGINVAGTFNMSSGVVSHNYAGDGAGGVHCHYLVMTCGSITNNHAASGYAGGVNANNDATLSGNVTITGNTNNTGKSNLICKSVIIADALSDTSSIGIKTQSGPAAFTSGWKDNMGDADPSKYFTCDNDTYDVFLNKNGEAEIGTVPHEHNDVSFKKWSSSNSLPNTADNYYLSCDVTISSRWNVPSGTTNLCLNGHSITRTNASGTTGSVIHVGSGAVLNLYDCDDETTRYYTIANPTQNGAGLGTVVDESAYNAASENARGTFTGGYITGGVISGELNNKYLIGGGVNVENGTFHMYGGTIIGNKTCINSGGVKVKGAGASFTMDGGAIIANSTDCYGGGISVGDNGSNRLCTVTINGGTIARNWSGRNGGAIHLDGYNHTLIITGGSIVNNYTDGHYENGSVGRAGGGVLKALATVKLSGNPVIKDNTNGNNTANNVYLLNTQPDLLTLSDLSSGADIGVAFMTLNASSDIQVAAGAQREDIQYIHYDLPDEGCIIYCDGSKDWLYLDGEFVDVSGTHHTHAAGTVWACTNPVASVTADETTMVYCGLDAALSAWTAGSTLKLLSDVTTSSTISVPEGEHTLDLNGHGIRMTGTGCVIRVNEQSTLNLKDSDTSTQHKYKVANPAGNGAGVATVDDTLTSGYQTFTGGYITGGYNGGGYNYGAGINVEGNGAALNMYGGTIIGNRLTSSSTGGGGVCLQDWDKSGGFNMYGGSIIGNTSNYGGGVYVRCGKMVMYGGEISNNVANNNIGGGVLAYGNSSTFIMEGGTISGNFAKHGGAINASGDASVSIFGGVITNNTATDKGGALTNQRTDGDNSPAVFSISGAPVFSGNTAGGKSGDVYLCNTALLNVTGELTSTTPFIVSRSSGTGVFTSGWKDIMGDADPSTYFTSDNDSYVVALSGGEATVKYPDLTGVTADGYEGDYDGTAHGITVNAPVGATIKYGTAEGSYTLTENPTYTDAGTYTVYYEASMEKHTSVYGSAVVQIDPIDVAVTVTGHSSTVNYDGESHSVTGYDVSFSTPLYTESDFTFSGEAKAERTNAGTTAMGLSTVRFANINNNFATVTFNVTDGSVTVTPIDVTVTITGHHSSVDYDGDAHSVTGYDFAADTPLYTETDFTFSGEAKAERTDAGTSVMGLTADQFTNTNENFANVTFNVTDGTISVCTINVTVTVIGHSVTTDYDGELHSVTGYDVYATSDLYDLTKDFTFTGTAAVERTDAGTSVLGLTADQFANVNANFEGVTFIVTDGFVTIDPIDVTVTVTGHSSTVNYDGELHSISGYDLVFSNPLYTEADFTFSGTATAERTDAGTSWIGLTAGQFANHNANFASVTFNVTDGSLTVNPINVTVSISGHTVTADYDGTSHSVSGYDVVISNPLYTEADFVFSGLAVAERTDAGTTVMGLEEKQFVNSNNNFAVVTFDIKDGYISIDPIDVTVTVTGYSSTVDYDGGVHTVTGYDLVFSTPLYTEADFTFSGDAKVVRTDVGITTMGLSADQFTNSSENFAAVTFNVTDGYLTVNPVDAVIKSAPREKDKLVYTGSPQELILPGTAIGGSLYYALGADAKTAPADSRYSIQIPTAAQIGNYYVWYKVVADANHNSLAPACIKITLAEPVWVTIRGTVALSDGMTASTGATVTLMQGSTVIDTFDMNENGEYYFTVPTGVYNLVVTSGSTTVTDIVDAADSIKHDVTMPSANTVSVLEVVHSNKSIVVGGLGGEADSVRKTEGVSGDKDVTVRMTVTSISAGDTEGSAVISGYAADKNLEYYNLRVEKTVDLVTTAMDSTQNVMEIVIPSSYTAKREFTVYRCDGSSIQTLTRSDSKAAGTYRVDLANGLVYIYSTQFSTFAVGYKPHYQVKSEMTLGSFTGDVSVKLMKDSTGETYELNNVSLDNISFTGIPKGTYTMTITWKDGAENTLTLPFVIK